MALNVNVTVRLAPEFLTLANRVLDLVDQTATIVALTKDIRQRTSALTTALQGATPPKDQAP